MGSKRLTLDQRAAKPLAQNRYDRRERPVTDNALEILTQGAGKAPSTSAQGEPLLRMTRRDGNVPCS